MKSIERQYLTFYAVLGEAKAHQMEDEVLMEALRKTHEKAYKETEATWRGIQGLKVVDYNDIEMDTFELCEDDVECEERGGLAAFGVGFTAGRHLPLEVVRGIRACVERAYEKAGAEDGLPVRFAGADRMNVLRVTETAAVDFDVEPPPIE